MRVNRISRRSVLLGTSAALLPFTPGIASAAQKQTHVPQFLVDAGADVSNFRESANFVVRWGDAVDVVEWGRQHGFEDYPAYVLNAMERTWDYYADIGLVNPNSFAPASEYRINLYLAGSWSGDFLPPANWAGLDEIGVGHMCLPYDKIWDRWVESHEFNHVLQSYACEVNNRRGHGGGFGYGNPNSGRFWEAHANFMARMRRPGVVTGSGYYGEHHYEWLSQQTYYGDWLLLNKLRDTYGVRFIHRLWQLAEQGEHPIQTIKRLLGLTHEDFAALIGDYARRNVVYDYQDGNAIRGDLWAGEAYRPLYTVGLDPVGAAGEYRIPDAVAPRQYGFNLIELRPDGSGPVTVRLTGDPDPEQGADWRFSFAAVRSDFSVRYSSIHAPGSTGSFQLGADESHLVLAVAATPSVHVNFGESAATPLPYQVVLQGATPGPGSMPKADRRTSALPAH